MDKVDKMDDMDKMNEKISAKDLQWMIGVTDKKGQPAGPGPEGYRFEHKLVVKASAGIIWQVLSNVKEWKDWSVLYPKASGELIPGSLLQLIIYVPGTKKVEATALVEKAETEKLLVFKSITKLPGALMNGVRYFVIKAIDKECCIVTDGEVVGGILGVTSAHLVEKKLFKGLQLMNEGLKKQAESYRVNGKEEKDADQEK